MDKKEQVDAIIKYLGLESCRDTRVGTVFAKGISGGQKRRLSIGIELVTQPARVRENYLKELETFVNEIKSACAKNEVDYVLVNTKDPVEKTISDYLLRRTAMAKSR